MSILEELTSQLSSRDVILGALTFVLGWAVAYYYHRQLRRENRELKARIIEFEAELVGHSTDSVRRHLERLETIPEALKDEFGVTTQDEIESYNEEIAYAKEDLEKQLQELIGPQHWDQFRSSWGLVIHHLRGKESTVGDCLLDLKNYDSVRSTPDNWYDAFCTALYHSKKFERLGVSRGGLGRLLRSRYSHGFYVGHTGIFFTQLTVNIKLSDAEDVALILDHRIAHFVDKTFEQLKLTFQSRSERIHNQQGQIRVALA